MLLKSARELFTLMSKVNKLLLVLLFALGFLQARAQSYIDASLLPNANYHTIVTQERARIEQKRQQFIQAGQGQEKSEEFREEEAQFERWAYDWRDKIGPDGKFPNSAQGWINAMQTHPYLFNFDNNSPTNIEASTWTNLGPTDQVNYNGWTFGAGIAAEGKNYAAFIFVEDF